jgi:F-type H+-transporting ATPase subunit epsilon
MVSAHTIKVVLVTPEKTLLDADATSLRFPLEDGQIGILPNRAPMVGRLGSGELKIHAGNTDQYFFIEGGFCQVKGETVTILTNRAIASSQLNVAKLDEELRKVEARPQDTLLQRQARTKELERLKHMRAVASHNRH